jgi:hypothetical protein
MKTASDTLNNSGTVPSTVQTDPSQPFIMDGFLAHIFVFSARALCSLEGAPFRVLILTVLLLRVLPLAFWRPFF